MKIFISFSLIISLLIISFSKSIICLSYQLNKDFISKNLCENRDKPGVHCNGKCQMIKKLKEDNRHENLPVNVKHILEMQFYSEKVIDYKFSVFYSGEILFSYSTVLSQLPVFNFFHPPQA